MPFGNICDYRRKFTQHKRVMLILNIFPEILVSCFLLALPAGLMSSKNFFLKKDPKFYFNLMLSTFKLFMCVALTLNFGGMPPL